jgi:hypothetical protein
MAGRLQYHVAVRNEAGEDVWFGPDTTEIPRWAVKQITNPSAWAEQPDPEPEPNGGGAAPKAPPMSGKGSGRDDWAAYAASVGVAVPADATRDDIVALVEAQRPAGGQG